MASVKITINGVICDLYGRTLSGPVKIVGEAMYSDLGVGGGPMPPGQGGGGGGGNGDHIWGPTDPRPSPPIHLGPGGDIGGVGNYPDAGLPQPQPPLPPHMEQPEPGDPTVPLPPPPGRGGWPVSNIVPPPYIVVNYPGIGPVIVAPPADDDGGEQQPPTAAPKK